MGSSTGASFTPCRVTVTSWVVAGSWASAIRQRATTVSPAASNCVSALSMAKVQGTRPKPVAGSISASPVCKALLRSAASNASRASPVDEAAPR